MPKIRTMGAGLAGSTARNVSVNSNTGGGNKKQGLSTTTNKRVQFVSNAIKTRSYGENRNVIFCVNQLGGVGAVGGGNGSRMFGTTSDGVKDCITGPYGCEQVVREAYLEAYGREPDKSGLRTYCIAMTKRRWSKDDIIADLVKNGDSLACNTDSESESICGHVIDGSISGATVTQMQNGVNVVIGATNAQGYFDLTLADTSENASPFVATGGTDIATGLPNKLTLKSNGAVISPTTTVSVVIREANTSLTVDEANQLAADYLGITKDQVTSDYVNDLESSNVDVVTSALVSQRASVQIATIIETAAILSEEENNESVLFNGLGNLIAGDATVVVTDATATTDIVNNSSGATINTTTLTNISTIIADVFNDSEIQTSSQVSQLQVEIISQAEDEDFVTTISNDVLDENDTEAIASNIVTGSDEVELPGSNNMPVIVITGNNTVTVELATTYTDAGATATDSSGETITVTTSGTVNINVIGTYSIMYSATDSAGLQAVQLIRTVNVVDTTPPIITVTGDNPATVELGSTYIDAGVTVTDLSEPVTVTSSSNVDVDIVDSYTVTYTAIDSEGVSTQATRTVNVVDTTAPVITVTGDNPVTVELGSTYTDAGATATDLSEPVTVTSSSNVDVDIVDSYTVTYTATDNQGVSAQATRTVNVVDTTAPVITVTGDNPVTVELGSTYTDDGATATDLSEPVTVTSSSNVDVDTLGSYTVTYTATDNQGVSAQATRTVNVVDTTAPVITVTGDNPATVELGSTYTDDGATASDLSDPVTVTSSSNVDVDTLGSYTVTYTATDNQGVSAQATRTVNVVDTTAPVITVTGDNPATVELGSTYIDAGVTVTDLSDPVTVTSSSNVDVDIVDSYTVTYTATDNQGVSTQATRTVNVVDTTAPNTQNNVLSANIVVKAGISVTIGSSGDITNNVWLAPADTTTFQTESYIKKAINGEATSINAPNAEGTYYIYVIDQAGNVSQPSTNYVIVDNTAPAIIVTTGTDTILKGGTWTDAGATADSGETVNVSGAVDTSAVGTYTITYTATDSAGNTGEATRTVTVVSWNVSVYGDHGGSSVPDDGIYRTTKIDTSDGGGVGQQWDFVAGTNGVQYEYLFNRNDEDKERVGALSYGNRKIEILFNFVLYSPNDTNTLDSHYININAGKNDDQLAFETDQLAFAYIENSVHGKIYRSTITPPTNNAYVNVWPTTAVANQPTNYYTPDVTYEVTDNKSKIILDFSDFSGIKNQATNGFGLDATDDDKKYYLYINRGFISYGEDGFYPLVPPVTGADYALITLSNY